jgi:uncharacterized protein
MKVGISDIVKFDGASLNIEFNEALDDLNSPDDGLKFGNPVYFKGQLVNIGGVLKLDGHLKTTYESTCFRCLNEVLKTVDLKVKEDFTDAGESKDSEGYTYSGNYLFLDKVLVDNIILNLPMKQLCRADCKGICPKCGIDLNEKTCECKDEIINPKMSILKDFFKNN